MCIPRVFNGRKTSTQRLHVTTWAPDGAPMPPYTHDVPGDHLVRRCIRMRVPKAPRVSMRAALARTRMQEICLIAWTPNGSSALVSAINALLATRTRTCGSNQDDGAHAESTSPAARADVLTNAVEHLVDEAGT